VFAHVVSFPYLLSSTITFQQQAGPSLYQQYLFILLFKSHFRTTGIKCVHQKGCTMTAQQRIG